MRQAVSQLDLDGERPAGVPTGCGARVGTWFGEGCANVSGTRSPDVIIFMRGRDDRVGRHAHRPAADVVTVQPVGRRLVPLRRRVCPDKGRGVIIVEGASQKQTADHGIGAGQGRHSELDVAGDSPAQVLPASER